MGDPGGRRLMIKEMILENFKSYAGAQRVGPFHKNFSAVVGPNGSGKSNVIDAMLFVFGRRAKQLRFNKVSELIHNSTHHRNLDMARVQVFFQEIVDKDGDGYEVIPGSEFVVSRTAHRDNKSEYFVNEKKMTAKEVTTMLKEQGIDLDNNRFLILQGEVEQISLMKPKGEDKNDVGFLEYLEDIIGTDRYKPMIEDAANNLDQLTEQRTMMAQKVKGVEKELQGLEGSKKEAEDYLKAAAELQQTIIKGNSLKIRQVEMRTKESTEKIAVLKQQLEVAVKEKDGCSAAFKESQAKLKALEKEQARAQAAVEAAEKHFKDLERQDAKNLEDRKHLSQKIKKLAAKVVSDTKALEKVKSESVNMDDKVPRLKEELQETTLQLQEAEQKVQQLTDSLKPQVQALNQEASAVRLDLAPWEAQMQQVRSRLEVAESEHRVLLKKQEDAQQRVVDTEAALQAAVTANQEQHQAKEQLQQRLAQSRARLADMQRGQANCAANEERLDGIVREMRRKVDGMRHEINSQKSASQAITALMEAKARGEIPGFLGRLGDLGAIDAKYDIAVSTAVGALDYLVVETAVDGQKGVELLRRNNLGIATFLILEKQQHLTAAANQSVQTPEGVPRLFDLVKTQDKRLKVAFYFAMGNMVVANDLEQAKRIGYGRDRKFASVVTLQGQLISQSGTMTGGGSKPRGGRMLLGSSAPRNIDSRQAAKELQTAEEQLARSVQELDAARAATADAVQQVKQLEKQTSTLEMDIPKAEMRAKAEEAKAKDLQKQLSKLQNSTKVDAEESQRITALAQSIATQQAQLQQLQDSCQGLKQKLQGILDKIDNVGGKKMKAAKDAVEQLKGVIGQLEQELTNKTVKSQSNRKQIQKLEKEITKNESEKGKVEQQLKELEQAIQNLEEDAISAEGKKQQCEAELQKAQAALEEGRGKHEAEQEQFNSVHQKIEAFKDEIKELQRGLKDEEKALAVAREKVRQAQAKLQELEVDVEMFDEELYEGTDEELTEKTIAITNEIVNKEQVLQRMNGDLTALLTYKAKEAELGTKTQELQTVTQQRDEVRKEYENLRKKRLDEFMAGFNIISLRLKEMYQMITLGGDAELELVDSLDPFSEGIVFSVRPPKKSWKCIANLSGGEKTLSSLSLVFALHHFKPTPLYVMDEIDAALDFRNVSIVGHYIKERTRNAQFVIISLRNNMFELADRMVGIYKTDNCTKSVCVNPCKFNLQPPPQSRTKTTQQSNDENMQQPATIPVV